MNDIRVENWYWKYQKEDDAVEAERNTRIKKRQRFLRFRGAARKILLVELGVIGIEALYHFGALIRGYNSFGGESLVLIALAGAALWYISRK